MSRLAPPAPDTLNDRQRDVYQAIASGPRGRVRGPLAVWLHRPDLAERAQALGVYCRYGSSLPARLSELAVLVTARVWGSEFEWQAHKEIAIKAGLAPEIVEAIRRRKAPPFARDDEAVVHDFALALQAERRVPQALYDRAVALLGEGVVVDLTGVLGYYALISMTINVFEIDPPDPAIHDLD